MVQSTEPICSVVHVAYGAEPDGAKWHWIWAIYVPGHVCGFVIQIDLVAVTIRKHEKEF